MQESTEQRYNSKTRTPDGGSISADITDSIDEIMQEAVEFWDQHFDCPGLGSNSTYSSKDFLNIIGNGQKTKISYKMPEDNVKGGVYVLFDPDNNKISAEATTISRTVDPDLSCVEALDEITGESFDVEYHGKESTLSAEFDVSSYDSFGELHQELMAFSSATMALDSCYSDAVNEEHFKRLYKPSTTTENTA